MRPEEQLERLSTEPVRYSSLLGFFAQHALHKVVEHGSSAAFIGVSDERWAYLFVPDPADLPGLLRRVYDEERITAFATLETWMVARVRELGPIESELTCLRYVLHPDRALQETATEPPIRQLQLGDAPTICDNSAYGEYISRAYIEEVIARGFSAGIEEEGTLIAWATTHDDLAIGNLHVLPSHRRRGYAATLVSYLAREVRKVGYRPVVNIEESNTPSRALARRLGFAEDREVTWIKLGG